MTQSYHQTLYDLREGAKVGLIGNSVVVVCGNACSYHNDDHSKFCAIGYLLKPAHHKLLDKLSMNEEGSNELYFNEDTKKIAKHLKSLGLSYGQAADIQHLHDKQSWYGEHVKGATKAFIADMQDLIDIEEERLFS